MGNSFAFSGSPRPPIQCPTFCQGHPGLWTGSWTERKLSDHPHSTLFYGLVNQSLSHVRLFAAQWTTTCQAPLFSTISKSLLKFMSNESMMPSNHLILLLMPSIFPRIRVFSNKSALCIRWPKYWSFNFSISPSNEYSGLTSFRIDQFDLLICPIFPAPAIGLKGVTSSFVVMP